jgi:hypothetical protein
MLVNINYQIEFDKIPDLVASLLKEARSFIEDDDVDTYINCHLRNVLLNAEIELEHSNYTKAIKSIEEARRHLVTIDAALGNSSDILRGYTKQLVDPQQPEEDQIAEPPDFSDMQEKLAQLKQNISEATSE